MQGVVYKLVTGFCPIVANDKKLAQNLPTG